MKLKNIIISALAVASLASCVDLNYSEVTTNDEQWVYQSPVYGIQRLVTSVYARIPNGFDKNFEGGVVGQHLRLLATRPTVLFLTRMCANYTMAVGVP